MSILFSSRACVIEYSVEISSSRTSREETISKSVDRIIGPIFECRVPFDSSRYAFSFVSENDQLIVIGLSFTAALPFTFTARKSKI